MPKQKLLTAEEFGKLENPTTVEAAFEIMGKGKALLESLSAKKKTAEDKAKTAKAEYETVEKKAKEVLAAYSAIK